MSCARNQTNRVRVRALDCFTPCAGGKLRAFASLERTTGSSSTVGLERLQRLLFGSSATRIFAQNQPYVWKFHKILLLLRAFETTNNQHCNSRSVVYLDVHEVCDQ